MSDAPLIDVWVTVGRRDHVTRCLPQFLRQCTYPNYRLLIAHQGDPLTLGFLESVEHPNKVLLECGAPLADKYATLLEHSEGDYWYSIQDDWWTMTDPGPMMQDAVQVLLECPNAAMVRMTSHCPLFLDALRPDLQIINTTVSPVVMPFGLVDMQTVARRSLFDIVPDLWLPRDTFDFYAQDGVWQKRLYEKNMVGAVMLRWWGCCYHAGSVGERGFQTEENRLNARESRVLVKYKMFGSRPREFLYSGALTEEQRHEFIYPLYLHGLRPLVPGFVPVAAQDRLGPKSAEEVF